MRAEKWQLKTQTIEFESRNETGTFWNPALMAIVNVTPDSFSDGGKHFSVSAAVEHALRLVEDGATILDVGGESTRPYADPIDEAEELHRVIPVIQKLSESTNTPISIDTSKAKVAQEAVAAGAEIINDITGLEGDAQMIQVAADTGAGVCAMHLQGTVQTMQDNPQYDNVVEDIYSYLKQRLDHLRANGIAAEKICLDPGIGFGKTHEHNWELLRGCERFIDLGQPILVGHSRKGFIGKLLQDKELERDSVSAAIAFHLAQSRIQVIRLHEVAATARGICALAVCGRLSG